VNEFSHNLAGDRVSLASLISMGEQGVLLVEAVELGGLLVQDSVVLPDKLVSNSGGNVLSGGLVISSGRHLLGGEAEARRRRRRRNEHEEIPFLSLGFLKMALKSG